MIQKPASVDIPLLGSITYGEGFYAVVGLVLVIGCILLTYAVIKYRRG